MGRKALVVEQLKSSQRVQSLGPITPTIFFDSGFFKSLIAVPCYFSKKCNLINLLHQYLSEKLNLINFARSNKLSNVINSLPNKILSWLYLFHI